MSLPRFIYRDHGRNASALPCACMLAVQGSLGQPLPSGVCWKRPLIDSTYPFRCMTLSGTRCLLSTTGWPKRQSRRSTTAQKAAWLVPTASCSHTGGCSGPAPALSRGPRAVPVKRPCATSNRSPGPDFTLAFCGCVPLHYHRSSNGACHLFQRADVELAAVSGFVTFAVLPGCGAA